MDKAENLSRKRSLFASAAVLAPMTQAASGQGWPAVVGIAVAAWLMSRWCGYGSGWVLAVQKVWCCVLVSVVMKWSTYFWTGLPFCGVVPLILLILGAWAASVPGKAQRIGCVLLWPLLLLLGAVLLSGVSEVKLSYLRPVWGNAGADAAGDPTTASSWVRKKEELEDACCRGTGKYSHNGRIDCRGQYGVSLGNL